MTYPGDPLEGLDPTDTERLAFLEALDEAEAEEAAGGYGGYGGENFGPWDDFNAATAQMDAARQFDGQRIAEDITDDMVPVFLLNGTRTSAGPGPGPVRLPRAEAGRLVAARIAVSGTDPPDGWSGS